MNRRAFVRLVGGGVILAAGASLAGCAMGMPDDAVSAWKGPGDEPDIRRWILGYAILAPHSHNLQSWLVDLRTPQEIQLRCDLARTLPETDPFFRQILMSHGTFLELLDIAARERGHRAEVTLFPEGEFDPHKIDGRPVASIRLIPDASVSRDPLFAQILHRQTNRRPYHEEQAVPDAAWQAMAAAVSTKGLRFGFVTSQDAMLIERHRSIARDAWRIEVTTPRTMLESYHWLRVGANEINEHRDGISITSPMLVALDRLGLFDRSKAPEPDDRAVKSQISDFDRSISSTNSFLWISSADNSRATQVAAGRSYARVQLAAIAQGVVMQPISQALQEYPEQANSYRQIHELTGAAPAGETVQMWARVGYANRVDLSPRRALSAHILSA